MGLYLEKIKADPDTGSVQISFYPSPFNRTIAGACSDPVCSIIGKQFRESLLAAWVLFYLAIRSDEVAALSIWEYPGRVESGIVSGIAAQLSTRDSLCQ
jgi:hypothetical protein